MSSPRDRTSADPLHLLESAFEEANVRIGEATWSTYSGEGSGDLDGAHRQVATLLADGAHLSLVETLRQGPEAGCDPQFARRLEIWKNVFSTAGIENDREIYVLKNRLQHRIASFSPVLDGSPVRRSEIQKILRTESDRDRRRRAWRSIAPLSEANRDELHRLIVLRNRGARSLGYRDYVHLVLAVQGVDQAWLEQFLDHLFRAATRAYARLVKDLEVEAEVQRLSPWDVTYAMRRGFQLADRYFPADRALALLNASARAVGFAADQLPIRTVIRDIPFGGYTVAVRIPSDVRFLVNPAEGHGFYTTTFHEYGHSVAAALTEVRWPILKEYEWVLGAHTAAYSEGMAEVLGEFARREDWLRQVAGVSDPDIEAYTTRLLPAQMLIRFFELFFNFKVELAAYREEFDGMATAERDLAAEIRLLEIPDTEPSLWEANTWYTSYPVYWQNYILASVVALQVHEDISSRFGAEASSNPGVAEYLRANYYAEGNARPWLERIERGTGKRLQPQAFLRRVLPEEANS